MNADALRAQLFAIRAQVDALIMQLDPEPPPADEKCPHPPAARQDRSVMGSPERWICRACGFEYDGGEAATT